jgi:hypothetical protein
MLVCFLLTKCLRMKSSFLLTVLEVLVHGQLTLLPLDFMARHYLMADVHSGVKLPPLSGQGAKRKDMRAP